jgi:hypothetical protein
LASAFARTGFGSHGAVRQERPMLFTSNRIESAAFGKAEVAMGFDR